MGGSEDQENVDKCGQGEGVVSQMLTSAWKKTFSCHICEIYSNNLVVCLHIKFSFCLYSIENVWNNRNTNVCTSSIRMISFLPFRVNCSQSAMFQIIPALCPHGGGWSSKCGQEEGVVNQMWTGLDRGRRVPKIPKFLRTSFVNDP